MAGLPRSGRGPAGTARLKARPEDFIVEELLGFEPDGDGSHVMLWLEKRGLNTDQVARTLARHAGARPVDVGYSGLKDRHALTRQWFSVNLQGRDEPDWSALDSDSLRVLRSARHHRKLKRGAHRHNRFCLLLRDFSGDQDAVAQGIEQLACHGMPNYFTEQRFGRHGNNLAQARRLFAGARADGKRGYYLSAARAWLFNLVLAERIRRGLWDHALDGDVMNLQGTRSVFTVEAVDDELRHRLATGDIHPTGPMWGRGELPSTGAARDLELSVLADHEDLRKGLEAFALDQERRPLRVMVAELTWQWLPAPGSRQADLQLQFTLPRGSYATALVRELVNTYNADDAHPAQQ